MMDARDDPSGERAGVGEPMDGPLTPPDDLIPPDCPACGSGTPVRIAYGYPTGDMFETSQRGELALGGCVVGRTSSTWACRTCGHRWGGPPIRIDGVAAYFSDTKEVRIDG
jgi:ribosomal protein L37AE/L43A